MFNQKILRLYLYFEIILFSNKLKIVISEKKYQILYNLSYFYFYLIEKT